jgi:hypothetical protein
MIPPKKYANHLKRIYKRITGDDTEALLCALIAVRLTYSSNPKLYTKNGTMLSAEDYYRDVRKELVKNCTDDQIKRISEPYIQKGVKNPFRDTDVVFKYASSNRKNTDITTSSETITSKKRYVRYQEKSDFKYM